MESAAEFIPVLIMFGFAVGLTGAIMLLTHLIGRRKPNPIKQDYYECGVPPLAPGRKQFSIRFYVVAILFILFDFETLVLLPWAIIYKQLLRDYGWEMPLISILIFLGILIVGFVYEVKKGALKWE